MIILLIRCYCCGGEGGDNIRTDGDIVIDAHGSSNILSSSCWCVSTIRTGNCDSFRTADPADPFVYYDATGDQYVQKKQDEGEDQRPEGAGFDSLVVNLADQNNGIMQQNLIADFTNDHHRYDNSQKGETVAKVS
mmetsp:Transcript_14770/g.21288  ORF Transcript_14770/g.21288 Transcript_14770/m.21288 type:complete len:135 (-) Transcript_14770:450-854(-)